jgi:hypothetical protein
LCRGDQEAHSSAMAPRVAPPRPVAEPVLADPPVDPVAPTDAYRKAPRTFQCRESLWEAMSELSRELECSVDYLLNESIKMYLRSRPAPSPARPVVPTPPATPVPPAPVLPAARLVVSCEGQRLVVDKDRFFIGRGKTSADLVIADGNVSRQHAMIEQVDGHYFVVDMGSTNGVYVGAQAIARKAILHNDVITICDHVVSFTYEP